MNHLLEPELDGPSHDLSHGREISLGPGTILGIFFVLALICACFFGFGYSVGHRSGLAAAVQPMVVPTSPAPIGPKPAAGSAAHAAEPTMQEPVSSAAPGDSAAKPAASAASGPLANVPANTAPASGAAGPFMVQVAAVSSQEIADIEVAGLKKDGYAVVVRHEPQDKLLHVQIGPFTDRKDAEAMRQRVLADGFNAIVK